MADLFTELGFDSPRSRWDAERADDFDNVAEDEHLESEYEDLFEEEQE